MTTNPPTGDRRIMMAVHGVWGGGKTWLAHTAPGPRLTIEMEGGSEDILSPIVPWDPRTEPIPTNLTDDTSVVVDIQDYSLVTHLLGMLESGDHPFNSVVLDSLTESQKALKTKVAKPGAEYDPNATFDQQAWGRLLNHGELVIRRLRDLTRPSARRRVNVVVVMGSDTESIPVKPLLQGALRKSLAGFFDLEGYLYVATNTETKEEVRILQISPSDVAEAKCRLHKVKLQYGTHIINPNVRDILAVVNSAQEATS